MGNAVNTPTRNYGFNEFAATSALGLGNGQYSIATLVIHAGGGGSGYNVGDVIQLTGGTGVQAQAYVTAVAYPQPDPVSGLSGVVTAVSFVRNATQTQAYAGYYSTKPGTSAVATTALTGSGSGLTLDVTYGTNTNTIPTGAQQAVISALAQGLTWRDDGIAPTATVGNPIAAGTSFTYCNPAGLANVQVIQQSSGGLAQVQFLGF